MVHYKNMQASTHTHKIILQKIRDKDIEKIEKWRSLSEITLNVNGLISPIKR